MEWYDTHIGRALNLLEERGLLEDTLVIATSDHGMPFPRVKGQIYDEGFRVPLAARWGSIVKPGRVVTDFITFPDVAPTLLEAAGMPIHEQMTDSSSLYALLSESDERIDPSRNYTLLGKERHDIGRVDGELISVSHPLGPCETIDIYTLETSRRIVGLLEIRSMDTGNLQLANEKLFDEFGGRRS